MKRTAVGAFALFAVLSAVSTLRAQSVVDTTSASKFYIGVKGGLVLSTVWGPDLPAAGTLVESALESLLPGVSAGVNVPFIFNDHFILEPELLFTTKGVRWIDTTSRDWDNVEESVMRRHNHIDIPVLAKLIMLKPERRFRPVIYLGPQLSLNIHSYTKKKGEQETSYSHNYYTLYDSTSFVDLSVVGGLGLHIRAGRGFFIIDARGNVGFLNSGNGDGGTYPGVIRNLYAVGSISYCFNPKRKKSLW